MASVSNVRWAPGYTPGVGWSGGTTGLRQKSVRGSPIPHASARGVSVGSRGIPAPGVADSVVDEPPVKAEVAGETYDIIRSPQGYSADGGRTWAPHAREAVRAAQSEHRAQQAMASREQQRVQTLQSVVASGRASPGQKEEYAQLTDYGRTASTGVPYYTDASGTRWTEDMLAFVDPAEAAALRYAAATKQPRPTITSLPRARRDDEVADVLEGDVRTRTLQTGIGEMDVMFTPVSVAQFARDAPVTEEGIRDTLEFRNMVARNLQFDVLSSAPIGADILRTAGEMEGIVAGFEKDWPSDSPITSPAQAYDYTMARGETMAAMAPLALRMESQQARLARATTDWERTAEDLGAADRILGVDEFGTGKLRTLAVIRSGEAGEQFRLQQYTPGEEKITRSGVRWGLAATGWATIGSALAGPAAPAVGVFAIPAAGLAGATAGVAYEGYKMGASRVLMGLAPEEHKPAIRDIAPYTKYVPGGELASFALTGLSPDQQTPHVIPAYGREGGLIRTIAEFPDTIQRAKDAPSMADYYEMELRGMDTSGWEIYRPDIAGGFAIEAVAVPGALVTIPAVQQLASGGVKPLMELTGRKATLGQEVTGDLYETPPKEMREYAGGALHSPKGVKLSGEIDIVQTDVIGSRPGTLAFRAEQALESPLFGGAKAHPYKVIKTVQHAYLDDKGVISLYTAGQPTQLGETRLGVELAGTQYDMMVGGKPLGAGDVVTGKRMTLTTFEQMGIGSKTDTLVFAKTGAYDPRTGFSGMELRGVETKMGDITSVEFAGRVQTLGKVFGRDYGITGQLGVMPAPAPKPAMTVIKPAPGPKTPLVFPETKAATAIDTLGKSVSVPVTTPGTVTPTTLGGVAMTKAASVGQLSVEYVPLTTPPGFVLPPGVPDVGVRMDELVVPAQAVWRGDEPPGAPFHAVKRPPTDAKTDELVRYRRVPAIPAPPPIQVFEPLAGDTLTRTWAQGRPVSQVGGRTMPPISDIEPVSKVMPPVLDTAQISVTATRTPELVIAPIFSPARAPSPIVSTDIGGFVPFMPPPPGPVGIGFPSALTSSPFKRTTPRRRVKRRPSSARIKPMYHLMDVFAIEARTGRKVRHPRGERETRRFRESLAAGMDFGAPAEVTGRKRVDIFGRKSTKRKRGERAGFKLF